EATGLVGAPVGGHGGLADASALLAAVRDRYSAKRGAPSAIWDGAKLRDYAPYPLRQFGVEPTTYADLTALLDAVHAPERNPDPLAHPRAALLAQIEPRRAQLR